MLSARIMRGTQRTRRNSDLRVLSAGCVSCLLVPSSRSGKTGSSQPSVVTQLYLCSAGM